MRATERMGVCPCVWWEACGRSRQGVALGAHTGVCGSGVWHVGVHTLVHACVCERVPLQVKYKVCVGGQGSPSCAVPSPNLATSLPWWHQRIECSQPSVQVPHPITLHTGKLRHGAGSRFSDCTASRRRRDLNICL